MPNPSPEPALGTRGPAFQLALTTLEPELRQMQPRDLLAVNLDVPAVVLVVLGALPWIDAHRAEMVGYFGQEMVGRSVDRLELVARAAAQAHVRSLRTRPSLAAARLSAAVVKKRAQLVTDVEALIHRGLLGREILEGLRGIRARRDQCFDLVQLASVLREEWARIAHATPLTPADIDAAEALANDLAVAIATRGQGAQAEAADLRDRAFTLLVNTYDDVRRMASFLRWKHGDLEELVPSLYSGRRAGKRSRGAAAASAEEHEDATAAPPGATGLGGALPWVAE